MADVSKEMIYHLLKHIQSDIAEVNELLRETNAGLNVLRSQNIDVHSDIHNLYCILVRRDARLERIERRLEITEQA